MRKTLFAAMAGASLMGAAAPALAAKGPGPRHFTEKEAGMRLSSAGNRFENLYRIKRSPFGAGATIRDASLTGDTFPISGKDNAIAYYKDGRLTATETFTLGTPHANGVEPIKGTGTCSGGTFKHQGETCTYTLHGTYSLVTGKTFLTLAGTYTPSAHARTGS